MKTTKTWMWCNRCLSYVWTDGSECPTRHFSTLSEFSPRDERSNKDREPSPSALRDTRVPDCAGDNL